MFHRGLKIKIGDTSHERNRISSHIRLLSNLSAIVSENARKESTFLKLMFFLKTTSELSHKCIRVTSTSLRVRNEPPNGPLRGDFLEPKFVQGKVLIERRPGEYNKGCLIAEPSCILPLGPKKHPPLFRVLERYAMGIVSEIKASVA